jgi:hypothetical protein
VPVRLKVDFPDAAAVFKQLGLTGAVAMTRAMGEIVDGWKAEIRAAVRQNFKSTPAKARKLGLNFEKSFQGTQFPEKKRRKVSFHPAGFLNAKANFAEIFETGGPRRPRHGKYLAIALPAARKLNLDYGYAQSGHGLRFSKRSMVEAAEKQLGPFRPIRAKGGNLILAATTEGGLKGGVVMRRVGSASSPSRKARGKKRTFVPLFLLVKRTVDPKKLNFIATARRWLDKLPGVTERITAELMAKRNPTDGV